jgi:hypothetical protein
MEMEGRAEVTVPLVPGSITMFALQVAPGGHEGRYLHLIEDKG